VHWYRALALLFSTILLRIYSGSELAEGGAGIVFVADHAAVFIMLVRLRTARSISSGDFSFVFSLIFVLISS